MKITVNYFAYLREKTGKDVETLELIMGSRALDLIPIIFADPATQGQIKSHCRVAVNEDYCPFETPLSDGDTVALIPPVAGG